MGVFRSNPWNMKGFLGEDRGLVKMKPLKCESGSGWDPLGGFG